jgi:hypothetical protein
MPIVERRSSVPRWYYVLFGIAMLATGSFAALLTMNIRWKPKAKKAP